MFEARTAETFADDIPGSDESRSLIPRRLRPEPAAADYMPSHYAAGGNRKLIWLVIAGHALALWGAIQFDVVGHHHRHQRLQVELVPLDIAPPPKASPPAEKAAVKVQTPIVSPPPIVQQSIAVPATVLSAPVPVPARPAVAVAPTAPVVAEAAPIVAPDGFAANLGNTAPSYPLESRRQREEGTVRLRVLISPQGLVEEISVAKSSGFDRLDDAALRAVRKWRFRPGTQAGAAVEAVGFLSIPFKLTH